MPGRSFIVLLVALGALCCPFRCLHHSADSVAFFAAGANSPTVLDGQIMPPSPPAEQNESGCICRGAIPSEAPTLAADDEFSSPLPPCDAFLLKSSTEPLALAGARYDDQQRLRPPLSGRMLRALHSSLLL